MNEDNQYPFDSSSEPAPVKQSPLSPKWWHPKEGNDSGLSSNNAKSESVAVETATPPVVVASVDSQPQIDNPETASLPPSSPVAETEKNTVEAESVVLSGTPVEVADEKGSVAMKDEGVTTSTSPSAPPSSEQAIVTDKEDGKILKTMSDVAAKTIERNRSSLSKLTQFGGMKKQDPQDHSETPVSSEGISSSAPRESFVTSTEKESRLKAIREAAAQKIAQSREFHTRQASSPVVEKKPEVAAVVTPVPSPVEMVAPEVSIPEEIVSSPEASVPPPEETASQTSNHSLIEEVAVAEVVVPAVVTPVVSPLDILVPPPPRPAGSFSSQNKPEVRTSTQTRINEAYLRQLKGEEPSIPDGTQKPKESSRTNNKPQENGSKGIPVEDLGVGVFNALGDMVGGVVHLARAVGGGVKKVVDTSSVSQESGTNRMVLGAQGMLTGVKEIVKGGGNIVIGTIGLVTVPVAAVIKSMNKSESKEA
jgi:hypothetical protein